jgi:hypothetical protein
MCYNCGTVIETKIFRSTTCPACGRDVRVCLNCVFYSPGSQWDCREHISEPVRDKEHSNFCDFFKYKNDSSELKHPEKESSRKAFDDLFNS